MKNYLNKNDKSKNKIRKKKIVNPKENNDNTMKKEQTVVFKKNSLTKSLVTSEKRDSFLKENPPITDTSNLNSGRKPINFDISGKEKKIDLSELYLKKNVNKIPRQSNSFLDKERCTTPMANYNKIINRQLIPSIIRKAQKKTNNSHKKIALNCLTYVDRKKEIRKIEEEGNKPNITVEIDTNQNNYIYNKPNIIIKKQNNIQNNNIALDRPQSATPIYKRAPKLNPSLYKSNIPILDSFLKENSENKDNRKTINTPLNNKKDNIKLYPHKLNRYYSYF